MRVSSPETTDPVDPPGSVPVEKRAGVARVDKFWVFTKTGVWQRQEPTPEKREEKWEPKQERQRQQARRVRYSMKFLLRRRGCLKDQRRAKSGGCITVDMDT